MADDTNVQVKGLVNWWYNIVVLAQHSRLTNQHLHVHKHDMPTDGNQAQVTTLPKRDSADNALPRTCHRTSRYGLAPPHTRAQAHPATLQSSSTAVRSPPRPRNHSGATSLAAALLPTHPPGYPAACRASQLLTSKPGNRCCCCCCAAPAGMAGRGRRDRKQLALQQKLPGGPCGGGRRGAMAGVKAPSAADSSCCRGAASMSSQGRMRQPTRPSRGPNGCVSPNCMPMSPACLLQDAPTWPAPAAGANWQARVRCERARLLATRRVRGARGLLASGKSAAKEKTFCARRSILTKSLQVRSFQMFPLLCASQRRSALPGATGL